MPQFYSSNMVLQRDRPIVLRGTAKPGINVKASVGLNVAQIKTDEEGEWKIELPAMAAGGPHSISITDGEETIEFENVLLGDVWLASGQSNMDWLLKQSADPEEAIAQADYPEIRLFKADLATSAQPLRDVKSTGWHLCKPNAAQDFSAVAYYFGRELHLETSVPIGLIHAAAGGTSAQAWTSRDALSTVPGYETDVEDIDRNLLPEQFEKRYQERLKDWTDELDQADPAFTGNIAAWAKSDFDDSQWRTIQVPGPWASPDLSGYDGTVWFRKTFDLPNAGPVTSAVLHISCADDSDWSYINGLLVGSFPDAHKYRRYEISGELLRQGSNSIAIRVLDHLAGGGICGSPDGFFLEWSQGDVVTTLSLSGEWKFRKGASLTKVRRRPMMQVGWVRPTLLYNGMIAPFVGLPIRGVIWYQGESNTVEPELYSKLFSTMISSWRTAWGQGDFPFLYVQLAGYMGKQAEPGPSAWAELRDAQRLTLQKVANVAMATAVDIGEEQDIHPKNKKEVGRRLALGALALSYMKPVEFMGPLFEQISIGSGGVSVSFKHAAKLAVAGGGELQGFEIAGEDRRFVRATAKISGNAVLVSHEQVKSPKAIRYGWADFPLGNLQNEIGLPASPFRTDDWKY